MEAPHILSLPDDVLLAVLASLTPRELFLCRLVCLRLRDLSLHRDLWKNTRVREKGVLRAALHLAPCLAKIGRFDVPIKDLASFAADTKCVVPDLALTVHEGEADLAADVLLKLSAAGGVKKLDVYLPEHTTPRLLQAIFYVTDLQELVICNIDTDAPLPADCCNVERGSSLTMLYYSEEGEEAHPFLILLLKTHAATLQDVTITTELPVSSLACIPGLRSLASYPHEELPLLLTLPLARLELLGDEFNNDFPPGALDFLRRARHLQDVWLCVPDLAVLVAVSSLPSARFISSLEVVDASDLLQGSVSILLRFPSLRSLRLGGEPSIDFLRAISPESAPCLATLNVRLGPADCPHAWLHRPAVQDLLVRNPRLHLRLRNAYYGGSLIIPADCRCPWCSWGCHRLAHRLLEEYGDLNFSSHNRKADCPLGCFQVAVAQLTYPSHASTGTQTTVQSRPKEIPVSLHLFLFFILMLYFICVHF